MLFCSDIRRLLLPQQYGDDEEGIDRLVAAIVYSRSPEPRKWLWFNRLCECASLLQLPSYLRVMVCAGIWAWSELCIRARLRVDLHSTPALPLQEVSTHQNHS